MWVKVVDGGSTPGPSSGSLEGLSLVAGAYVEGMVASYRLSCSCQSIARRCHRGGDSALLFDVADDWSFVFIVIVEGQPYWSTVARWRINDETAFSGDKRPS